MGDFLDDHPLLGCLGILALLGGLVYAGIEYGPTGWAWAVAQWDAYQEKEAQREKEIASGRLDPKRRERLPEGYARAERDGALFTLGLPQEIALPHPMPEDGPPPLLVAMMIQNDTYRPLEFTDADADWELVLRGPQGELARTKKDFWIRDVSIAPADFWMEHDILPMPPADQWQPGAWRVTWTMKLRGQTVAEITAETKYHGRPTGVGVSPGEAQAAAKTDP